MPEVVSSCLNTKPDALRTKPDVCAVGLLSSESSQVGTGDSETLNEAIGSGTQLKTSADEEHRLDSVPQASTSLPKASLPTTAVSVAEVESAKAPELQKHLEPAPCTSKFLSAKLEEKVFINGENPDNCMEKKVEPSTLGCQSQNLKESSGGVDNENYCTRSNNKTQNGECFLHIFIGG